MLAGEAGIGQVLGGGAAAHGDRDLLARVQLGVGSGDCRLQCGGQRCIENELAATGADLGEVVQSLGIQTVERRAQAGFETVLAQEVAERIRRGGKAVGNAYAGFRQLVEHFTQGGVLASNPGDVGIAQLPIGQDLVHGGSPVVLGWCRGASLPDGAVLHLVADQRRACSGRNSACMPGILPAAGPGPPQLNSSARACAISALLLPASTSCCARLRMARILSRWARNCVLVSTGP